MQDKLARFFGHQVELRAKGMTYQGLLIGADEELIYLKSETMYMTLPLLDVTAIRRRSDPHQEWELKPVEGEPKTDADERLAKKRYRDEDLARIHELNLGHDWPGDPAAPDDRSEDNND